MTDDQLARLRVAVRHIIADNRRAGYIPSRFIQETENGYSHDLEHVCVGLITSAKALEEVEKALRRYPDVEATLEGEIMAAEDGFGFQETVLEQARANTVRFAAIRRGEA